MASESSNLFDVRMAEVRVLIKLIAQIQARNTSHNRLAAVLPDCLPILKACVFLMTYNVVESVVRTAFGEMFDQIRQDNQPFAMSTLEIQKAWLTQRFSDVPSESANRDTYLNLALSISQAIATSGPLELSARHLPISGNLDADRIRHLFERHGIPLKVNRWSQGGAVLELVKDQRNALAHGHKSFVECGRDYDLEDLRRILGRTAHFVGGLIKSVERYRVIRGYVTS